MATRNITQYHSIPRNTKQYHAIPHSANHAIPVSDVGTQPCFDSRHHGIYCFADDDENVCTAIFFPGNMHKGEANSQSSARKNEEKTGTAKIIVSENCFFHEPAGS